MISIEVTESCGDERMRTHKGVGSAEGNFLGFLKGSNLWGQSSHGNILLALE